MTPVLVYFFCLSNLDGDIERHKTKAFAGQDNGFARALYILVYFLAILCKTTIFIHQTKAS